jgi:hypothetical protein
MSKRLLTLAAVMLLACGHASQSAGASSQTPAQREGTSTAARADSRHSHSISHKQSRKHSHRHYLSAHREPPSYYERPRYYRPYPYSTPAPFIFGFAFAPWWY